MYFAHPAAVDLPRPDVQRSSGVGIHALGTPGHFGTYYTADLCTLMQ